MKFLICICLFLTYTSYAQNLVPNPGFEGYNLCAQDNIVCDVVLNAQGPNPCKSSCCRFYLPEGDYLINGATHNWSNVYIGNSTYSSYSVTQYWNACTIATFIQNQQSLGYAYKIEWYKPRTGGAHIIIDTYGQYIFNNNNLDSTYRNYAQVKLRQPLQAGCTYEVLGYALLMQNDIHYRSAPLYPFFQTPSDGLGMYVSKDSIYVNDVSQSFKALTSLTPQITNPDGHLLTDSINYQKISGLYTATGGEQWLVIGNFKDNAHTQTGSTFKFARSQYGVDDVSVTEWKPDLVAFTDTSVCVDSMITITLPEGLKDYKWSTGETTRQIHIAGGSGRYTVEASNGCTVLRDTFYIHAVQRFNTSVALGTDTFFCKIPNSYQLQAPAGFDMYEWSTGSTASNIQIIAPDTYWVKASYACGTLQDTIVITQFAKPDFVLIPVNDTAICSNSSIDLQIFNASIYSNFIWNDGTTQNHLLVHQANQYSVKAYTPKGCEVRDTIQITTIAPPLFFFPSDTLLCEDTELKLEVPVKVTESIVWNDGTMHPFNRINNSGVYWAILSNTCFNTTDSITVTFVNCTVNIPNLITVNGDHFNDYFVLQTEVSRTFELSIYTSWGSQIYHNATYQNNWNAEGLDSGIYFYYINDPLLKKNYKGWLNVLK